MRGWTLSLFVCLLGGCAVFTVPAKTADSSQSVSAEDLLQFSPGDWARVTLPDVQNGPIHLRTEHVGTVVQANDDSITLSCVKTKITSESPAIDSIPVLNRIAGSGVSEDYNPRHLTLAKRHIARVERVPPETVTQAIRTTVNVTDVILDEKGARPNPVGDNAQQLQ